MITKIKNWIKRFKKWLFALFIIPSAFAGGLDAVQLNETPIQTKDVVVASEQVHLEQKGNVVEATMPWKGQAGLKVKYDYGEPSLKERIADKRDKEVVAEKVPFSQSEGFKIDILLKEKPDKNVFCYYLEGWEDYDFYRQGELSQKEKDEGAVRPDEIVGSYAIYHKTLKDHKTGGVNYETGKFGHIPFPYVWEVGKEKDKIRATDLTFNKGNLCVVVPQDFLDKADYKNGVRIDPTFGYTTAGASSMQLAYSFGDRRAGRYYSAPANGTLDSISAYVAGSASFDMKAFVNQKDSVSSGSHGQIVAITNTGNSSSAGWKTFTAGGQSITSGTNYILNVLGKKDTSITSRVYHDAIDYNGSNIDTFIDFTSSSGQYVSPESPWTQPMDNPDGLSVWALATNYSTDGSSGPTEVVKSGSWPKKLYPCIANHTSSASTEPGVGASWTSYWIDAGNVAVYKYSIYATYTDSAVPVYDTTSSSATVSSGSSITLSHTVANQSNRVLLVGIVRTSEGSVLEPTGVTYNSVAMTKVDTANGLMGAGVSVWKLIAPDTGTHDIVASFGSTIGGLRMYGVSVYNANQAITNYTSQNVNFSNGSSISVASQVNSLVIDFIDEQNANQTLTVGADQTYMVKTTSPYIGISRETSTGASTTMSWTIGSSDGYFSHIGVSVDPVASASPTAPAFINFE